MTIKQQGGIFGRNPTFNDVEVDGTLTLGGSALPSVSNTPTLDGNQTFSGNNTFSGDVIQGSVNLANSTGTGNVVLSNDPVFGYKQKRYSGDGRCYSYDVLKLLSDIPGATATDIFTFTKSAGGSSSDVYSAIGGTLVISAAVQLTGGYNLMQTVILPFGITARGSNNAQLGVGTQEIVTMHDNTGYSTTWALSLSAASNTSATLALSLTNNRGVNVSDLGIQLSVSASASANALLFDVDRA